MIINERWKKILIAVCILIIIACIGIFGLSVYGKRKISKIPSMSFQEALEYTTKDKDEAVITVGVIKDGQAFYTVYGKNGKELPHELHTYEIGSITKTFTAAMINRGIEEGKIDINATIDKYINLPEGNNYPTVDELLTHTSGYKPYYFEIPMILNSLRGRNDFYGITKEMILDKAVRLSYGDEQHSFNYSNYGYAILGLILEKVYDKDYTALVNEFVQNGLKLTNTKISDKTGDLGNYWDWNRDDAYLPAGGMTSDINDMLLYAQMQLDGKSPFGSCHKGLKGVNAVTEEFKLMNINMDEIGMAWMIDEANDIIWHNGGTDSYNSYIGFCPNEGLAVVVLSNLSPRDGISATVLGVKALTELKNS